MRTSGSFWTLSAMSSPSGATTDGLPSQDDARSARSESPYRILVPVSSESQALSIIPIVAPIARAEEGEFILFCFLDAIEENDPSPPSWLAVVSRHMEEHQVRGRIVARAGQDSISTLLELVAEEPPALLVLPAGEDEAASERFRRLFLNPPVDTLLIRGTRDGSPVNRILVFSENGPDQRSFSTRLARALDEGSGNALCLDFLAVLPLDASDDEEQRRREAMAASLAEQHLECEHHVHVIRARSRDTGLLDTLRDGDYDLVLADTPRRGLIGWLAERAFPSRVLSQTSIPVVFVSRPVPPAVSAFTAGWNRIYSLLPSLSEEDKVSVYRHLRRSSRGETDFYVMLILSTAIAALGLLLNSAAVVIGAMIIAPLMSPIIATGLGIVQGDGRLLRIALSTVFAGAVIAIVVAALVTAILPGQVITTQIQARGEPSLLDLLVALASGAAGAYAISRKSVMNTVAGVAIAVALVPPLASTGIGLALGDYAIAAGASLLFLTNFAALGAASSLVFLWMGFKPEADRAGRRVLFVRGILAMAGLVGIVAVGIFTFQEAGEARFTLRVHDAVEAAVEDVDVDARITGIDIGSRRDSVISIDVRIESTEQALLRANAFGIQSAVARELDRPTQVTMFIAESIEAPAPETSATPELSPEDP